MPLLGAQKKSKWEMVKDENGKWIPAAKLKRLQAKQAQQAAGAMDHLGLMCIASSHPQGQEGEEGEDEEEEEEEEDSRSRSRSPRRRRFVRKNRMVMHPRRPCVHERTYWLV